MKIRRMKKRHYAAFKRHRAFLWSVKKLSNKIFDAYRPLAKAFQEAYSTGGMYKFSVTEEGDFQLSVAAQEQIYEQP